MQYRNDQPRDPFAIRPTYLDNPLPEWFHQYEALKVAIVGLGSLMADVEQMRKNAKRVRFNQKDEEKVINETQEQIRIVANTLKEIHSKVIYLKRKYPRDLVVQNAADSLITQLQEQFTQFRNGHSDFATYIQKLQSDSSMFDDEESQIATYQYQPPYNHYQQNYQTVQSYDEEQEREREQEQEQKQRHEHITKLATSVVDLNDLFTQMSTMVFSQEETLDRIDDHINHALDDVKQANDKHLAPTEKSTRTPCMCYCAMALMLVIMVLIIIVVLKYK
jgi:t-SNARE complex subunit (syntaxin)